MICAMAVPSTLRIALLLIRKKSPQIKIETLVPDFRGRVWIVLDILTARHPDVFNYNLETYRVFTVRYGPGVQITTGRFVAGTL